MDEFLKLTWRKTVDDEDLEQCFLSEEAIANSYVYRSFREPINMNPKRNVKLHSTKEKYVPGLKYYHLIRRRSLLTKSQKSHCLVAIKLIQSGKKQDLLTQQENLSLQIYKECQPKITEENHLFLEYCKNMWLKNIHRPMKLKPGICSFAWPKWKRKIDRYLEYPQYYKEVEMLCLNFDDSESTVDFQHIVQPLEMGTLARLARPNFKEPCTLKLKTLQKMAEEVILNSKLPVSRDANILKLLKDYSFDVVISSSGLKQIIDFTNTKSKWIIPVIIKEITIEKADGNIIKKKVVFIDKVLPKVNPSISDLNNYTHKRLLKLNFCQYEAFSYPVKETPIENLFISAVTEQAGENTEDKDATNKKEEKREIHHNVNYRIWNIKKVTTQNTLMKNHVKDKEINILVRCKLDGCEATDEGVLFPIIVRPKIEQQIQFGANIPSKSELARDWTSLFFRLYSFMYRARIYNPMNEVISLEKCSLQKINSEAQTHYDYKPILGLGVLQKVLHHLVDLDSGNYLLQHLPKHESFLSVMKQCDDKNKDFYDLHAECQNTEVDTASRQIWLPIDVNYILPPHEEHNQIPAVFHGFDKSKKVVVGRLTNLKKKKKKKNSMNEKNTEII